MRAALEALKAREGDPLLFWLRDDDAVEPSPALDRLLALGLPGLLAVIPAPTGAALADRLAGQEVAQHGWAHRNHAGPGEKKQELGPHRPAQEVLAELAAGREKLAALYGPRLLPVLVPPWNRIAPEVVAGLPGLGLTGLSTFGPERAAAGLRVVNSRVDLMDWRAGRGRPAEALWAEITALARSGARAAGILTHHLVHDDAAWGFLEELAALRHAPGARWVAASELFGG